MWKTEMKDWLQKLFLYFLSDRRIPTERRREKRPRRQVRVICVRCGWWLRRERARLKFKLVQTWTSIYEDTPIPVNSTSALIPVSWTDCRKRSWYCATIIFPTMRPANVPSISGIIILDDDSKRIAAKYYNSSTRWAVCCCQSKQNSQNLDTGVLNNNLPLNELYSIRLTQQMARILIF